MRSNERGEAARLCCKVRASLRTLGVCGQRAIILVYFPIILAFFATVIASACASFMPVVASISTESGCAFVQRIHEEHQMKQAGKTYYLHKVIRWLNG